MARTKGVLGISSDMYAASNMIGAIEGLGREISTKYYSDTVIRFAHGKMARAFDTWMTARARAMPERYKHVYEWGVSGVTPSAGAPKVAIVDGRLWSHKLAGRGNARVATFRFRASKRPIPKPTEASTGVPQQELNRLSGRRYIFRWKAPLTEFAMPVTIRPRNADWLFMTFPNSEIQKTDKNSPMNFKFAKVARNPGVGDANSNGAFTEAWVTWWTQAAGDIFDSQVAPALNREIRTVVEASGRRAAVKKGKFGPRNVRIGFSNGEKEVAAEVKRSAERLERSERYLDNEDGDIW